MSDRERVEKLTDDHAGKMPDEVFAALGDGVVAYVRQMTSDDVSAAFPNAPRLAPGLSLWALLSADGTPILISDDHDAVIANAMKHELVTVSVH